MNGERAQNTVVLKRQRMRATVAAASAVLVTAALAGCVPSAPVATPSPTASPTITESAPAPVPTIEPLTISSCETLLPLSAAKALFSASTEVLAEEDSIPVYGDELPEIVTAGSHATIAKYCVWGVPNSGGSFALTIADINDTDAANLIAALLSAGYSEATSGGVTMLELESENAISYTGDTHYVVSDLWIYVSGTSLTLTTEVADRALDAIRTANPTRAY
jgi:hypothetical protein